MVVSSEGERPTLDASGDRLSGVLPSRRSVVSPNVTTAASSLEPALAAASSLLSVGKSATAQLRPALSAPLVPPVLTGALSPAVAAIGFLASGGAAVMKYGPHGKELDPTLKTVLIVATGCGLLITSGLMWLTCNRDRALKRTLKQQNTAAYGGMAGLMCTLLVYRLLAEASMTVLIPESLDFMNYLVPESYPTEMLSGLLISACRLGTMLSPLLAFPLTSGSWDQRRLKWVTLGCSAVFVAAQAVLAAACFDWKTTGLSLPVGTGTVPTEYPAQAQTQRLVIILSCQFIAGTVQGLICAISRLMLARVTPPSSQVTMAILNTVLMCAGVGLGPMLSDAVRQGLLKREDTDTYPGEVCGMCVLVIAALSALWLAAFIRCVPWSNEGVPVPLGGVHGPSSVHGGSAWLKEVEQEVAQKEAAQKTLFLTYLAVQTERAWLVAGLEVVTAMVMEQEFEISHRDIGFAVGSCFMIATPLIMLGAIVLAKQVVHPATMLVSLGVAVTVLCLLIFHTPAEVLHLHGTACLALLLSADTLIYPTAMTVGGIVQGLALGYAIIPSSQFYSSAVAILGNEMLVSGGRFMSMPISRLIVASGGRNAYAAAQFGMATLSLLSCIRVVPAVRLLVPSASSRSSSQASSRASSRPPSPNGTETRATVSKC